MRKRIKARFVGQDGSLGYKHGVIYTLRIKGMKIKRDVTEDGKCEYGSLKSFMNNWTDIKTLP